MSLSPCSKTSAPVDLMPLSYLAKADEDEDFFPPTITVINKITDKVFEAGLRIYKIPLKANTKYTILVKNLDGTPKLLGRITFVFKPLKRTIFIDALVNFHRETFKGIGTELIKTTIFFGIAHRVETISLISIAHAVGFYYNLGFEFNLEKHKLKCPIIRSHAEKLPENFRNHLLASDFDIIIFKKNLHSLRETPQNFYMTLSKENAMELTRKRFVA